MEIGKNMKIKYNGYSFELDDRLNDSYGECLDKSGITDTGAIRGALPQSIPVPSNREFSIPRLTADQIKTALAKIEECEDAVCA